MKLSDGIRKHGFRSWHERQLLTSVAWLVLALFCGVIAFASLEAAMSNSRLAFQLMNILFALLAGAATILSLHLFATRMSRAQRVGEQAACKQCETFGWLAIVDEDPRGAWTRVRCRQCSQEWVIEEP